MTVNKLSKIILIFVCMIVIGYAALLIIITWPISNYTIAQAGVFGDSFGIITSLFSGLAFAGMIITILLQKDELALQREELKATREELSEQKIIFKTQNFNDSFFRLLDYHKQNLADLTIKNKEKNEVLKGIDGLAYLLDKLKYNYASFGFQNYQTSNDELKFEMQYALYVEVSNTLINQSRYIETIVSIFNVIYSQLDNEQDKNFYLDLLASQLTIHELKYMFYRCLVSKTEMPLVRYAHDSSIFNERGQDIGVPITHRLIYTAIHNYDIVKPKRKFTVPFDRKKIRELKKRTNKNVARPINKNAT
ncbi:putative phage abortive infection protein [Aeromonas caviae]|uniref:putative phage abortive infection protein n=1 Tax=Aeromonas caviae TaxID=648 RepID=UPI00191E5AF3|nr:putative phage abortive infection protein [Aeromonas caviae]MBL0662786.1 hypothetical protein [Aeromonas caviae]